MKKIFLIAASFFPVAYSFAQKAPTRKEAVVPCSGTADNLPGKYTDHTDTKYPLNMKGTVQEKTAMLNQLIAIEKLEEASRKNFNLMGCVARVSFSGGDKNTFGNYTLTRSDYQLGVYQNVCNVKEHIVKTVGEYNTVLRVKINAPIVNVGVLAGGTGEFSISKMIRYTIPVDAIEGPDYNKNAKNNPSRVSKYVSERFLLTGRSDNFKDYHTDFLKLNNGTGFTENWLHGDRYGKNGPDSYVFIDRRYFFTKPGVPLLVPVSRKQFLEDMLEYFEIEKASFNYESDKMIKDNAQNNSDYGKQRMAALQADRAAYPQIYEAKKAKVKQLLQSQKADWLQQQAVVANNNNTYDANERLRELGKFYNMEDEKTSALYVINPEYFKLNANQPTKPKLIEVQFRYEIGKEKGYSERLFTNFSKNFNLDALKKMLE